MYVLATRNKVREYPYSIEDMQKDNPQVSFPAQISPQLLSKFNVFIVVVIGAPEYNTDTQKLVEVNPSWNSKKKRWETRYEVKEKQDASSI